MIPLVLRTCGMIKEYLFLIQSQPTSSLQILIAPVGNAVTKA